jgi:hypothetical protein
VGLETDFPPELLPEEVLPELELRLLLLEGE